VLKIYEYSMLYFVRYDRFVEILSCPTYREESSRLRPLCHWGFHNHYHWWCNRGFHNKWWCNKRIKQLVCSRFQFQIDQVILCLKSSVNQQWLLADKKLEKLVPVFISNVSNLSYPYTLERIKLQIKTITSSLKLSLSLRDR